MSLVVALLLLTVVSTAGLLAYTQWVLPRQVRARYTETFRVYSEAIELRFPVQKGLTQRVVALSLAIGKRLRLGREQLLQIEDAAQLRDLGLCAIPYQLLNERLREQWTKADWATFYRHADVGGAMLELVPTLEHLAPIVRESHTPYAEAPEAPIGSRILCAVNEYVWTEAREGGPEAAWKVISEGDGTRFDPTVVAALRSVLRSLSD